MLVVKGMIAMGNQVPLRQFRNGELVEALPQWLNRGRRQKVLSAVRQAISTKGLQDDGKWRKLQLISPGEPIGKSRVRLLESEYGSFAIKQCGRDTWGSTNANVHGAKYENYVRFHKIWYDAIAKGEINPRLFILAGVRPIGRVKLKDENGRTVTYLVMHDMHGFGNEAFRIQHSLGDTELGQSHAAEELRLNVEKLVRLRNIRFRVPQVGLLAHLMFVGHTNSRNPTKGRWVISLPHDAHYR